MPTLSLLIPIFLLFAFVANFITTMARNEKARLDHSISHWRQTVAGLQGPTSQFYHLVEAAIRTHDFAEVDVSAIALREARPFLHQREFLRIERVDVSFALCVAPLDRGLFVNSWLCPKSHFSAWCRPIFPTLTGWPPAAPIFDLPTSYRGDSAAMLLDGIHAPF